MIKILMCLRRLPSLTREEFQRYWLEEHAPLVRRHAPTLGMRRYTQSHTFIDPRIDAAATARGCGVESFDGVAEVWWDSIDDIIAAGATAEGRAAGRALLEDEKNFIDLEGSAIFFAEEHVVVG